MERQKGFTIDKESQTPLYTLEGLRKWRKEQKARPRKSESNMRLFDIFKGGPGSGNFGHKGVPGQRGGSAPRSGGKAPLSERVAKAVTMLFGFVENDTTPFDKYGVRHSREYGAIIKANGVMLTMSGAKKDSQLSVSADQARAMFGGDFIHTHPSGGSFSQSDIFNATASGVKSAQVVGVDSRGRKWHYTMKPEKPGEWPERSDLELAFSVHNENQFTDSWPKINAHRDGSIEQANAIRDATFEHNHTVWQNVAKSLGMQYTREKVS
jgi:hypothetical protein